MSVTDTLVRKVDNDNYRCELERYIIFIDYVSVSISRTRPKRNRRWSRICSDNYYSKIVI